MTWRSPIAATLSLPSPADILLFKVADRLGEAPLLDVDGIITRRKDAAPADLLPGTLHVILVAEPLDQLVHQPPWHHVPLAGIYEPEVQQRHQQNFPIKLHVAEQLAPVDVLVLFQ